MNFALSANGSTATASSTYSAAYAASATINGDRKGTGWGEVGGGWSDATSNSYPDWLQVTFNGSKTIDEVDVFTLQDNFSNPGEPTESMTFSQYGIVAFQVQYWNGSSWQTVSGGNITGNNKVWRKINFSQITTNKIRVNVTSALSNYSRITEVEAWGPSAGVSYTYDSVGNVTNDGIHSYTYDCENRVVSVDNGATAQYKYDHQNRRVSKIIGSSVTHYIWQGSQVIAEHDGAAAGQWTTKVEYLYVGGNLIATQHYSVGQQYSTGTRYYLSDIWSTRLVLDSSGNVLGRQAHLPFGDEFGESGTQEKHHFTSYETESETGTDYAVNRQYSQSVGRFQSADPYQASGYMVDPQSWNRYSYVENDPIHNVDPLGLMIAAPRPPDSCHPSGDTCGTNYFIGGDPGCTDINIEPPPEESSCNIAPSLGGSPLAHYRKTPREPNFNPNATPLGPIVTTKDSFPFWGYYFEVVINPVNLPFLGWTYHQSLIFSTSITYRLPDGTEVTEWPEGETWAGFIPNDPIRPENTTGLVSDTDQFHTWFDAPGVFLPNYHPLYNGNPVVSIHRFYDFLFEARNGTTACSSALHLDLTLNLSGGSPSAGWSH